ncbi:B-cell receptor CD22-like [Misgurnus anguillicaudatus]|uniref:B-cell receptor CD22-like n=1 Tax=Misgurnus anguillicaudatus TaxID=75329 RepID=UPI003CCF026B
MLINEAPGVSLNITDLQVEISDAPDKPIISIKPSGEIMEGDSVNLTCSSESNPPVHNYSWFKVNETSSVGSGQTYSISNFNSGHIGWFYCEAQNEVGSQRSAAVSLNGNVAQNSVLYVVVGVSVGCGGFIFILIIVFVWKCKHRADDISQSQVNSNNRILHSRNKTAQTVDLGIFKK